VPVSVAARTKARVRDLSLAGNVEPFSNECCALSGVLSLRRVEGVVPIVLFIKGCDPETSKMRRPSPTTTFGP
jgi:hypothetical protein